MMPEYLVPLFVSIISFLALRERKRLAISSLEGAVILAFAVVATVQGALQSQVHLDDVGFTAIYVGLISLAGIYGGVLAGVVAASFCTSILLMTASTHPLDFETARGGIIAAQWVTLWITLGAIGALSGWLARQSLYLGPLAILAFALFPLTHHVDALYGATPWAAMALGIALSAAALPVSLTPQASEETADGWARDAAEKAA